MYCSGWIFINGSDRINWRWCILISKEEWIGFHSAVQKVASNIEKRVWQDIYLLLVSVATEILIMHSPYIKHRTLISFFCVCLKVFRPQPLGCCFEKNWSLRDRDGVHFSWRLNLLARAKCSTVICIQICIECKDFDLDKTYILQNNIILRAIKTCINKGGVCTGKLVLLLFILSPPLASPSPIHCWCHCCSYRDLGCFQMLSPA